MPRTAVNLAVSADVGGEEPVHPMADGLVALRPKNDVKMVRHQAVGENAHRDTSTSLAHQPDERMIIAVVMENLSTRIATIEYVVTEASYGSSRGTWYS